jgi:hypothetical protein
MSVAYFVIAILGCGEAEAPCQTVRTLETRYESRSACTEATDAEAMRNSDVDYPVVVAQCVSAGAPPARVKPGEVLLPPQGTAPSDGSPVKPRRT